MNFLQFRLEIRHDEHWSSNVLSYQYELTDAECEDGLDCRIPVFSSGIPEEGLCARSCSSTDGKIFLLQFDCVMQTSRIFMNGSKGILRYFYSTWIKTEIWCSFVQPLRIGCGSDFICAHDSVVRPPLDGPGFCVLECSLASYAYDYASYNGIGSNLIPTYYADQIGESKYLNWTACEWYYTWHKRKLNSSIEIFFWPVNISCNSLFLHT